MKRFGLRPGDIIVFIISLTGLVWVYGLENPGILQGENKNQLTVQISSRDREWLYPLEENLKIEIEGPLGDTFVHIESGKVLISESPCKNKVCIAAGKISSPGSWIACLPNQVFIQIEQREDEESVDEISF